LTSIHKIRAGRQLSLYIDRQPFKSIAPGKKSTKASKVDQPHSDNTIILAGTKKRAATDDSSSGKPYWYTVKSGDSIWTIARKFKVSTSRIKKLNNLKSNLIRPGNRLKIDNV